MPATIRTNILLILIVGIQLEVFEEDYHYCIIATQFNEKLLTEKGRLEPGVANRGIRTIKPRQFAKLKHLR